MEAAALAGDPAEQPDLVSGAGAQPVVPAGGGVVLDEVLPGGAVLGDGAGEPGELGDGGRVFTGGLEEVLDGEDVMRRSGGRSRPWRERRERRGWRCSCCSSWGVPRRMSVVLAVAAGAGRSSGEPGLRGHQQLQQQQRTWAAHRNPRMGVRVAAAGADMQTRRTARGPDCQPNVWFGVKVSPHPVTAPGERFVQCATGDVALCRRSNTIPTSVT